MKQKANFLIFCMIFVGSVAFGQQMFNHSALIKRVDTVFYGNYSVTTPPFCYKQKIMDEAYLVKTIPGIMRLRGDYYSSGLGFFCKQEIKLEKTIKIPFKFRLGSIQYCDRMEGKQY